ncbi:hypothetical protein CDAR_8961 [Caerostris darwini]|uniref:Uncharacterized protein n=1 Tax=Caerostris darwini TaxID=1538125 RepID=A0AAV4MA14_9ARAC|nr:hypothetical protein CDAR_8961 [Caerostris darwini]
MRRNNIIQKFLRWNTEEDIPFIVTEPIKEAMLKPAEDQLCPGSPVKAGFWITQKGIETDPEIFASQSIPPLKSVKEVQCNFQACSFICSSFRVCIQNFDGISRPLVDLTKTKSL